MKSEFEWIRFCQRGEKLPQDVRIGIGDDCAVIETGKRGILGLLKCDTCVEKIHFTPRTSLQLVGRKVMARNLSDIAAMGGKPRFALVSVALPKKISEAAQKKLFFGLRQTARRFGCEIIGGDTSRSKSHLFVSVFLYGEVQTNRLLTRSGAKSGDCVYVTGTLGGSLRGKHLSFEPRLKEASWLAEFFKPTAAIDLSDGLGSDLQHLAERSKVGFEIFADQIPTSKGSSIDAALYDGEDYELLFCVSKSKSIALEKAWRKKFKLPLTRIGIVKPLSFGIRLTTCNGKSKTIDTSYDHFRNNA